MNEYFGRNHKSCETLAELAEWLEVAEPRVSQLIVDGILKAKLHQTADGDPDKYLVNAYDVNALRKRIETGEIPRAIQEPKRKVSGPKVVWFDESGRRHEQAVRQDELFPIR